MAEKSIYFNNSEKNQSSNNKSLSQKLHEIGKNNEKFGGIAANLAGDIIDDFSETASGFKDSLLDTFTGKADRNKKNKDFDYKEVSMANRHKDAIEAILNNTFSGNLWEAGVQTLNLYNTGTKWSIAKDPDIDKDKYSFKYLYYIEDNGNDYLTKQSTETGNNSIVEFLESIEDPTILGYSVKIDLEQSPLFGSKIEEFINNYSKHHREMSMCLSYRENFKDGISKIFCSPETLDDNGYKNHNKNYYIKEIKGLSKLDNKFVKYSEKYSDHDFLEFIIDDDVRMYVNRLAFLYRNLTYSYHMGKKLIPENLLRFNLYIKLSDIRSFTSGVSAMNKEISKDGYSRVIYELKDCEFIFPESNLTDSIITGGINVPTTLLYSSLSFKVKYRKVNRIFYSEMFPNTNGTGDITFIGDKFYSPNTVNYSTELDSWKYSKNYTSKRDEISNNIAVEKSLASRFDKLKNDGILKEKDSDTAVGRFAKSLGNKAIKQSSSIVDEGLNIVKNTISDAGNDVQSFLNNNINSDLKDLLIGDTKNKKNLGKRHDKVSMFQLSKLLLKEQLRKHDDKHPDVSSSISVHQIKKELHKTEKPKKKFLDESVYINPDDNVLFDNNILHQEIDIKHSIDEYVHRNPDFEIKDIDVNLHIDDDYKVPFVNEDLHIDDDYKVPFVNEDLHIDVDYKVPFVNEDLHIDVDYKIKAPNENLFNKYIKKK